MVDINISSSSPSITSLLSRIISSLFNNYYWTSKNDAEFINSSSSSLIFGSPLLSTSLNNSLNTTLLNNESLSSSSSPPPTNNYLHPTFICFFVFYFFGFSLVFCYSIYLLVIKISKWIKKYKRLKQVKNGELNLYPNSQPSQLLQYLFYIQIIPYFLIRFLIYFLVGFELLPTNILDISNNWSHSQIFLVAFTLSGILLHNTYFLIAFFWSELESFQRGYASANIHKRQFKHLLIFITCSLLWIGLEITMSVLVFIKCYPDLYSPNLNTIWFTWIVRIEHCLNAFLSISLIIWFLFYSIWKRKSMWNLSFVEGLKIYKNKFNFNNLNNSNNNNNLNSNNLNNNNNIEYNLSSQSSHYRNGPKLMNRIENTSKWLFYSMIICILVYLLQSISQLIFTEIYISLYGNGLLILYDSYIIVIGIINSLSDFTPFLMCYIFHKSNQIIRDIVRDENDLTNYYSDSISQLTFNNQLNQHQHSVMIESDIDEETVTSSLIMSPQLNHNNHLNNNYHSISSPSGFNNNRMNQRDRANSNQSDNTSGILSNNSRSRANSMDLYQQQQQHELNNNNNNIIGVNNQKRGFFSKLFKSGIEEDTMLISVPYENKL